MPNPSCVGSNESLLQGERARELLRFAVALVVLWVAVGAVLLYGRVSEPLAWYSALFLSLLLLVEFTSGVDTPVALPRSLFEYVVLLGFLGWLVAVLLYVGWWP